MIKYWPIDSYVREFKDHLAESIEQGYLLNDLPFFASEGLVELWNKQRTEIDQENRRIECDGKIAEYDFLIEGDTEAPKFPLITYEREGRVVEYDYVYRDCYLGVIPKALNNVYLIGYARPSSGGLANMTEMQGLFAHKLLTDEPFATELRVGLEEKLRKYNKKYFYSDEPTPADHVSIFGFYTEEVAKEIGINLTLKDCRNLRDIGKYFTYPNNADKYRQRGPYKVDRAAELIDHVYSAHKGFKLLWHIGTMYILYNLLFAGVGASLYFHEWINGYVFGAMLLFQFFCGYWVMIPITNTTPFYGVKISLQLLYIPMLLNPRSALMVFPLDFLITYVMRKLPAARYVFNDLKNKGAYRSFFQRYKEVYNSVRLRRQTATPEKVSS